MSPSRFALAVTLLSLSGHAQGDEPVFPHPYQPLAPGSTWTYTISQQSPLVASLPGSSSTERVKSVSRAPGRLTAQLEMAFEGQSPVIAPLTLTREGILAGAGHMPVLSAKGVYLPRSLASESRWSYEVVYESEHQRSYIKASLEALGQERIEVPAGAFLCFHIRQELDNRMEIKGLGKQPPVLHHQTDDLYYAKGVGLVLSVTQTPQGYISRKALVRYQRD